MSALLATKNANKRPNPGIGGYAFIYARGGSYLTKAENSMGFHAPQEAARILGESIDGTRRGQKELRR
jgi:cytochrome c552